MCIAGESFELEFFRVTSSELECQNGFCAGSLLLRCLLPEQVAWTSLEILKSSGRSRSRDAETTKLLRSHRDAVEGEAHDELCLFGAHRKVPSLWPRGLKRHELSEGRAVMGLPWRLPCQVVLVSSSVSIPVI